jgi:phage tail-like protein
MGSPSGKLMGHLPAIYRSSDDLRELLWIFESVLLGLGEEDRISGEGGTFHYKEKALAEMIASIPLLFNPKETRNEFVPWLARWVALSHTEGLSLERERRLIAGIVPLYAKRGTRDYLEEMLAFHTPEGSAIGIIEEGPAGFRIGEASVGIDTQLGGERPYWFSVHVRIAGHEKSHESRRMLEQRIRRVIDLAKPAHTMYELQLGFE